MTASTPCRPPCLSVTTGTPPPPTHTTIRSAAISVAIASQLDDPLRLGRRYDPTPFRSVQGDLPSARGREPLGLVALVDGTDELRRVGECGIGRIDDDLGEQRGRAAVPKLVFEPLLKQVADHPLGLGAEDVERVRRRRPCTPRTAAPAGRPAGRCRG